MSSGSQETRAELLGDLAREFRQWTSLGASFFRAAAEHLGLTVTDMQVMDLLESEGEATAGQLADVVGLTTGAITGMLNRLEEAGIVRRERDKSDGRRVIVRLVRGQDGMQKVGSIFASLGQAWHELASHYDEEQLSLLLEFLERSNALCRQEIVRLREAPAGEEEILSAPLGELSSAQLVFPSGTFRLALRAGDLQGALYQARFEGPVPSVAAKDGVVTMRYPRRLWMPSKEQRRAEVTLSDAIPWQIVIQGGALEVDALLGGLKLASLVVKGGVSMIHLDLPMPASVVPIQISGGASEITVHRPKGVAARAHLKGWVSTFVFDDQTFGNVGNNLRLQSAGFDPTAPYYDIEVASSASMVTITSG